MKLQSLNCPNCGSILKREGEVQICEACGSTFAIDYDDSDVEYEKVMTEGERNKEKFQHEKEMLETEFRLKEEARIAQEKRDRANRRKANVTRKITGWISMLITFAVMGAFVFFTYKWIDKYGYFDQLKEEMKKSNIAITETTAINYELKPEEILADSNFLSNAKASVFSYVKSDRGNSEVTEYQGLSVYTWNMVGEPEIYDCYILTKEDSNRLYFLVKITYAKEDSDETKEVYDALYLENIKKVDGKIKSDYAVDDDRGNGATDWTWCAALDSDQLYRSAILGNTDYDDSEKIVLPESITSAADETVDETVEETEAEEESEG